MATLTLGADMRTYMRRLFVGIFKAPNGLGRLILVFALMVLVFVIVEPATGELIAGLAGTGSIVLLLALALVTQPAWAARIPTLGGDMTRINAEVDDEVDGRVAAAAVERGRGR